MINSGYSVIYRKQDGGQKTCKSKFKFSYFEKANKMGKFLPFRERKLLHSDKIRCLRANSAIENFKNYVEIEVN